MSQPSQNLTIPQNTTPQSRRRSSASYNYVTHNPSILRKSSSLRSSPNLSERSSIDSLRSSRTSLESEHPFKSPTNTKSKADKGWILGDVRVAQVDVTKLDSHHASTKLLTKDSDLVQDSNDDNESGAQLIRKYCCGGGCCMNKAASPIQRIGTPVQTPDNDAFRSLNLKLDVLCQDTDLTDLVAPPEKTVTFSSLPSSAPAPTINAARPPNFMKPHPPYDIYNAPIYYTRLLTKGGAEKKTFHFDIDVTDYPVEGGVDFKVGGAIGICPPNYPEAVEDIFNVLGVPKFLRDKPVLMKTTSGRWPTIWGEDEARELVTSRREILSWCTDVQSNAPTKQLFRLLAEHASALNEKQILMFLASGQGQPAFCDLRQGPYLSISQLLHAFPSSKPPLDHLLSVLPLLKPRFYSLSNDPNISSERENLNGRRLIEVAVTVDSRPNWQGGRHHGVGSGFMERIAKPFIAAEESAKARGLSDMEAAEEARKLDLRIPMFRGLMSNKFVKTFGESKGPMILVGAGVGIAPFCGFIQKRLKKGVDCASKIWLVQGCRDSAVDELYSGELGAYEPVLNKKVVESRPSRRRSSAFRRSQTENDLAQLMLETGRSRALTSRPLREGKYVQDELRAQADLVWDVIRNNIDGRMFVCGSNSGMGEGVEQALRDVAMRKAGFSLEDATKFWNDMKRAGKLVMELW